VGFFFIGLESFFSFFRVSSVFSFCLVVIIWGSPKLQWFARVDPTFSFMKFWVYFGGGISFLGEVIAKVELVFSLSNSLLLLPKFDFWSNYFCLSMYYRYSLSREDGLSTRSLLALTVVVFYCISGVARSQLDFPVIVNSAGRLSWLLTLELINVTGCFYMFSWCYFRSRLVYDEDS